MTLRGPRKESPNIPERARFFGVAAFRTIGRRCVQWRPQGAPDSYGGGGGFRRREGLASGQPHRCEQGLPEATGVPRWPAPPSLAAQLCPLGPNSCNQLVRPHLNSRKSRKPPFFTQSWKQKPLVFVLTCLFYSQWDDD